MKPYAKVKLSDGNGTSVSKTINDCKTIEGAINELERSLDEIKDMYDIQKEKGKNTVLIVSDRVVESFFLAGNVMKEDIIKDKGDYLETKNNKIFLYSDENVNSARGRKVDKIYVTKKCLFDNNISDILSLLVDFDEDKINII